MKKTRAYACSWLLFVVAAILTQIPIAKPFIGDEEKDEEAFINIANHTSEYALSKLVSEAKESIKVIIEPNK